MFYKLFPADMPYNSFLNMNNKILIAPAIFLAIIVATWSIELLKLTQLPDGLLYDLFARLQSGGPDASVIIIETDSDPHSVPWEEVVSRLFDNGASAIAFTHPVPANEELENNDKVIFARQLQPVSGKPGRYIFPGNESPAPGVAQPPQTYGVYRQQRSWFETAQGNIPSLEVEVAGRLGHPKPSEPIYQVNFRNRVLPKIELQRVLEGDLIPDLLSNKVVVISAGQNSMGLYTPFKERIISPAHYHALALNTLLNDEVVSKAKPMMSLLILILASGVSLFILHYSERRYARYLLLAIVVASLAVSYIALDFFSLWLPQSALTLAILGTFFTVSNYKYNMRNAQLMELANSSEALARTQRSPESFYTSDHHWSQVATLLSQTLDLNRVMLLEKVPDDHRVKEVQSLNCDFAEISEMRRDYHRKPYADAIAVKGPVLLERTYLKQRDTAEDQFLVPLVFAGEVLGFWAFSTDPLDELQRQSIMSRAEEFAEQIAELLYHRARWREGRQRQENPWRKLLQLEAEAHADHTLNQSFQVMRRRISILEEVLDGLGNGALVYDLFGRIMQSNKKIIDVLEARGLAPFDLTAADLVARLTDKPLAQVRGLLSDLILERDSLRLPVNDANDGQVFIMKLSVLTSNDLASAGDTQQPFQLFGILFELIDVSDIKDMCALKERLYMKITDRLHDNIKQLLERYAASGWGTAADPQLTRVLHSTVKIRETLGQLGQISEDSILPIDVGSVLQLALHDQQASIIEKQIQLLPKLSANCRFAFASAEQLKQLFIAILEVLISDSDEEGEVVVNVIDDPNSDRVICKLSSQGFGLPQDRINEYIFGTETLSSEQFKALRTAADHVQHWSGELTIQSGVSEGIAFELQLNSFL